MDGPTPVSRAVAGRNIVIFSDGTGQRGGVYFDEARTNIYKLYRAARCGPDSLIHPERQLAFYDPGLGTRSTGGVLTSLGRTIYNYVSQATGLGITRNIIDCYAAIIELWRPGDHIFLFGFSRGAYTVRCLATALCLSGIPTQESKNNPIKRDAASARKLATRAVKTVYQHVSSPRDAQFLEQRKVLAQQFRSEHTCSEDAHAFPFFIGVFDTVAALADRGSLAVLFAAYLAVLAATSFALAWFTAESAVYWATWISLDAICVLVAVYIYTHLKFSFRLPGYYWWETVHLTTFRQQFYDEHLDDRISYARHAISIDERRADFKRVRWGGSLAVIEGSKIDRFEQFWFAGNHTDIGGGYPENESRLSDISLTWMIEAAVDSLGDEGLLLDRTVLQPHPAGDGMQHDETRSLVFRLAGKSDRDPVPDAMLHPTVVERFNIAGVLQYDVVAAYRPEALRGHHAFPNAYDNIPLPRQTCAQRIKAAHRAARHGTPVTPQPRDNSFRALEENAMDRFVSCSALLLLVINVVIGTAIFGHQCLEWLHSGFWTPMPLDLLLGSIRSIGSDWIGLQRIYDWLLALPLAIVFCAVGIFVFWIGGVMSAALYKQAAHAQAKTVTPAQTHA
jgi:uncharacterized protein (DUF2235 family)